MAQKGPIVVIVVEWVLLFITIAVGIGAWSFYLVDKDHDAVFLVMSIIFGVLSLLHLALNLLLTIGYKQDSVQKLKVWVIISTGFAIVNVLASIRLLFIHPLAGMKGFLFCLYRFRTIHIITEHYKRLLSEVSDTEILVVEPKNEEP